jgi:DMSO/TMAO reductase YedYZ molybdopterin-dependent catalytic subunit
MSDDRRVFLARVVANAGALLLTGCTSLSRQKWLVGLFEEVEILNRHAERLFAGSHALAPEFTKKDIAPEFRANGTLNPATAAYAAHVKNDFADWRITVDGLVAHPLSLSLADLCALPARTQITRHDCVEGWSCIGEWTGTPLALVLAAAKPTTKARYAVFYCADPMDDSDGDGVPDSNFYYESLDLLEATHPQTILAYAMNGAPLAVKHGAPIRLRAERQLGYKMAKYVQRIELVENFQQISGGRGGYWEDQGYSWYGGI